MPLIETRGTASSRAFGQFAQQAVAANYIEDVFSTYLYTGNSSGSTSQTITNEINLSGKGGMVWVKNRALGEHNIFDTARGVKNFIVSNATTSAQTYTNGGVTAFGATGFTMGPDVNTGNNSGVNYASWTFRKQAKFFDVVTWTGDGTFNGSRTINHSLGGTVGTIIVKNTSSSGTNWIVFHRSLPTGYFVFLNATNAQTLLPASNAVNYVIENVTSTSFNVNHGGNSCNASGENYVAYLFAHDAGGFGAAGTDNVISCGTYTGNGSASGPIVTLGWEPQWILIKSLNISNNWVIFDNMRGMPVQALVGGNEFMLRANTNQAENSFEALSPTATGFQLTGTGSEVNANTATYAYIAIRRGPMRTPTIGTSVFAPVAYTGISSLATITTGFVTDAAFFAERPDVHNTFDVSRLTGKGYLTTNTSNEERDGYTDGLLQLNAWDVMNGVKVANGLYGNTNYVNWSFRRAPGFFDVVCYTGDGTNPRYLSHNLGVVPEFIIVKRRGTYTQNWLCYHASLGFAYRIDLNSSGAAVLPGFAWYATPTATQFNTQLSPNSTGENYVAYLFASCPGVSKVGSYTGTGAAQTINCGFTGGARFVLIKRTDMYGGQWYVWDTARGITASNDPYLLLNGTAAEDTSTNYISVQSSGFGLTATAPSDLNASGGNYIFLAIA